MAAWAMGSRSLVKAKLSPDRWGEGNMANRPEVVSMERLRLNSNANIIPDELLAW